MHRIMLNCAIIYHVQVGKQKVGEDEDVGLVNQIDAYFQSPGCTVSASNVATHSKYAITEDKENVAPISSKKRGKQGLKGRKLKTPYKDRGNSVGKTEKKLVKSKGEDLQKIKYGVAKESLYFR